jgi:hypothetical protein
LARNLRRWPHKKCQNPRFFTFKKIPIDIEWKDGKVTNYRIASPESREVKVRVNGETKTIRSE